MWNGWPSSVDHSVREVLRGHQLSIDIQLEGRHALVERAERNMYDPAELGEAAVGLTIHDQSRPVEVPESLQQGVRARGHRRVWRWKLLCGSRPEGIDPGGGYHHARECQIGRASCRERV